METIGALVGLLIVAFNLVDALVYRRRFLGVSMLLAVGYLLASAVYGAWWIKNHLCY